MFYILQKKERRICFFYKNLPPYQLSGPYRKTCNIIPVSHVHTAAMLVLLVVR